MYLNSSEASHTNFNLNKSSLLKPAALFASVGLSSLDTFWGITLRPLEVHLWEQLTWDSILGVYEHCMQGFFNNMISEWKKTEYKQQGRVVQSWAKITQG